MYDKITDEEQVMIAEFLANGGKVRQMPKYARTEELEANGANFYRRKKAPVPVPEIKEAD